MAPVEYAIKAERVKGESKLLTSYELIAGYQSTYIFNKLIKYEKKMKAFVRANPGIKYLEMRVIIDEPL